MPSMALCCNSLISCFSSVMFKYFMNDFELLPFAPIITSVNFHFTFHMRCISIVRNLHYRILSNSFLITFLFPEIAKFFNILPTNKTAADSREPCPCCKRCLRWKKLYPV